MGCRVMVSRYSLCRAFPNCWVELLITPWCNGPRRYAGGTGNSLANSVLFREVQRLLRYTAKSVLFF